jgi:glycine/D-amino acid oxidase-like deaminating enzyme
VQPRCPRDSLCDWLSGHGVSRGGVIGEHVAERALGFEPTFDLAPFSLTCSPRIERNLV